MDMSAMKAPPGVQPVASETVQVRPVGGLQNFPATVMAFSDEEIVARIPGRILSLAYPGDRVKAGQVVVRMDAKEYLAQARQAHFAADSGNALVSAAGQEVARRKAMKTHAEVGVSVANASTAKAQADKAVAVEELGQLQSAIEAKAAIVKEREADSLYAGQNLGRKASLYSGGMVSLDDYQVAQTAAKSANAKLERAKADVSAARSALQASTARVFAADDEIKQAKAQARSAQSDVTESDKAIQQAVAEADSARAQSMAASSSSDSASVIAGYTQLRVLENSMVAERLVAPGSLVTVGQKLLMLHAADNVRIQVQLPEDLAAEVHVGTKCMIHYGAALVPAKLTSIFPTSDPATRTFTAEAIVPNPGDRFMPGSFATVDVQTSPQRDDLAVRSNAVQFDSSGKSFVWVVSELASGATTDWTCPMHTEVSEPGPGKCPICKMELVPRARGGKAVASRREVSVGASDGTYTVVTGGLRAGDSVIWAGFEGLVEGMPIQSVPWGPHGPQELPKVGKTPGTAIPPMSMGAGAKTSTGEGKLRATSAKPLYTCTMHPEVVLDHPGKCPKCGMELVLKEGSN
jgi:multidrug efflux pump subunit AcrA (membrane-fusion protein)